MICKVQKVISINKKLCHFLSRKSLITVYKSFISSMTSLFKASLVMSSGIIQGASQKLFKELGVETLKSRRWFRCLSCIYKLINWKIANDFAKLIPNRKHDNNTRNKCISFFISWKDASRKSFIPSTVAALCNLDEQTRNSKSISIFKSKLLSFTVHQQDQFSK